MCKRVELCLLDNIETAIAHRDGCLLAVWAHVRAGVYAAALLPVCCHRCCWRWQQRQQQQRNHDVAPAGRNARHRSAPQMRQEQVRCQHACPVSHRFRCGVYQDKLKMNTVEDFIDCCDAGSCPTVTVGNGTLPSLRAGEWATVRLLAQRSGSSLASDVGGEGGGKTLLQLWVNGVSLLNASVDTSVEARGAGT